MGFYPIRRACPDGVSTRLYCGRFVVRLSREGMWNINLRKCEIVQQIQYLPGYPDNWRQEMEHKLDNHPNVEKWAYIPHDSDVDEDGKPVAPHIHLVLGLNESLNTSTIGNIIGVPQQYVSPIKQKIKAGRSYRADIGGALLYLTHRNAPEKHQYSDDQVVAKAGYDWIAERAKSEKAQEAINHFRKRLRVSRQEKFAATIWRIMCRWITTSITKLSTKGLLSIAKTRWKIRPTAR